MNYLAHDYNEAREKARVASEKEGKKILPLLGYSAGPAHILLDNGTHRRADGKRRDVSGKAQRREKIKQRAQIRELKNSMVAQYGEEKAARMMANAINAATS